MAFKKKEECEKCQKHVLKTNPPNTYRKHFHTLPPCMLGKNTLCGFLKTRGRFEGKFEKKNAKKTTIINKIMNTNQILKNN